MGLLLAAIVIAEGGGGEPGAPSLAWIATAVGIVVGAIAIVAPVVKWARGDGARERSQKGLRHDHNQLRADHNELSDEVGGIRQDVNDKLAAVESRQAARFSELSKELMAFVREERESRHRLEVQVVKSLGEIKTEVAELAGDLRKAAGIAPRDGKVES